MFSTWDIVRPRYWHPMASLEQSMMDLDDLANLMLGSQTSFPSLMPLSSLSPLSTSALFAAPSTTTDDDDFFRDLPLSGRRQALPQQQQQPSQQPQQQMQQPQQEPQQEQQQQQPQQPQGTFSSYSFSNSSIVDDKGRRVVSTRRRYEDSNGRLKALHEREIDGKKMRAVWNRMSKDDEGKHEKMICAGGGTPEEFEEAWKATPFGEAHQQQEQRQAIKDTPASGSAKPSTSGTVSAQTAQQ